MSIELDKAERWKLIHFTQAVNSKSYYRKYAGLIDRVKKSMLDNGVIAEVREVGHDERGHETKGAKTPFVILKGNVK